MVGDWWGREKTSKKGSNGDGGCGAYKQTTMIHMKMS